jgi:uncharacterized protein YecE (DUF72 family)
MGTRRLVTARIGTSGWSYDHWGGVLYPPGTPAAKRLPRYVAEFDTVELNASFHRWPKDATFDGWRQRLPEGFTMSVKAHRGLTHFRRLRAPEAWVERFESCWNALGDRHEALLVQLHPEMVRDDHLLDHFLTAIPASIRVAIEFRHASWHHADVYSTLERHGAAYVIANGAGLPSVPVVTSELVYLRLHGPDPHRLYVGSYSDDELRAWRDRILRWTEDGHRTVVYFNNDLDGNAVTNARTLKDMLRQ